MATIGKLLIAALLTLPTISIGETFIYDEGYLVVYEYNLENSTIGPGSYLDHVPCLIRYPITYNDNGFSITCETVGNQTPLGRSNNVTLEERHQ